MQALDASNKGLRLNTLNPDEYFLIENRQPGKWDRFLPGYGMLVARVDSTDANVWEQNTVNCRPSHMYYELLRADFAGRESASDPFPGTSGVTSITNFTTPSLLTWDKSFNEFNILGIAENDGLISFELVRDTAIMSIVEDFENMPVTTDMAAKNVPGVFATWNFSKSAVSSPGEGECDGSRAVAMKRPSMISTAAPLSVKPLAVSYTVYNPTTGAANFKLTYSLDNGETWMDPLNAVLTVDGGSKASTTINLPTDARIMLRINQTAGNANRYCYLDNIKVFYSETWPPEPVEGDVNGDGEVNIADVNDIIDVILTGHSGRAINADVDGNDEINIGDVNRIIAIILSQL